MGFEPLLSFDGKAAAEAFGKQLEKTIQSLTNTVMETARANLGGDPFYDDVRSGPEGLKAGLMQLAETGMVVGNIGADAWQAWIAEWGSGSEMDTTNPEYESYKGSVLWNKLRDGNAITGREAGDYPSLDGTTHTSSGLLAGVNLEVLMQTDSGFAAWAHKNIGPQAFEPKIPFHFLRDALESNRKLIIRELTAVIEAFSFGAFFV